MMDKEIDDMQQPPLYFLSVIIMTDDVVRQYQFIHINRNTCVEKV